MLRSVLLVVDPACFGRVIERAARLPLARDARLTILTRPFDVRAHAMQAAADLVVVGHPGRHVAGLIGRVPVLVVRHAAPYRRPLVAIDPSYGGDVVELTRELLPAPLPSMTAVHVNARVASVSLLGVGWTRYLAHGDVRTSIARAAKDTRADLVVIGSRPRTALSRLLFGSVSGDVLRNVACDVLAVPTARQPVDLPVALSESR